MIDESLSAITSFYPRIIDIELENGIIVFQRLFGGIMLVTSIPVCLLIFTNRDIRSRNYRKYELSVQFSSMLLELWICMGVPIFMPNYRIVYMAGYIPFDMDGVLYLCICVYFVCEMSNSYVSCLYYRRTVLRAPDSSKVKATPVYFLLRVSSTITVSVIYLLTRKLQLPIKGALVELSWLRSYTCVLFLDSNGYAIALAFVLISWGVANSVMLYKLCIDSMHEVKHGMKLSSVSSKAYQRRAVSALLYQVSIPSIFYIIPIMSQIFVLLYASLFESQATSHNRTVTMISAIIFNMVSLHTIVHSITIVASSHIYRRRVLRMFGLNTSVRNLSLGSLQ